jgi:hypothetical protein
VVGVRGADVDADALKGVDADAGEVSEAAMIADIVIPISLTLIRHLNN